MMNIDDLLTSPKCFAIQTPDGIILYPMAMTTKRTAMLAHMSAAHGMNIVHADDPEKISDSFVREAFKVRALGSEVVEIKVSGHDM